MNRVLSLTDGDNIEYRELFRNPDYAKILKKFIFENTIWRRKRSRELLDFSRGSLIEETKTWFYFMNLRLIPSKHVSTLYKDREILLYGIMKNFRFNTGNVIEQSILEEDLGRLVTPLNDPQFM